MVSDLYQCDKMVTIKDDCCGTPNCSWKEKLEQAYARATISINKITDQQGSVYYPDGTGNVQIPIPTSAQIAGIGEVTSKVATLESGLEAETTARISKDTAIDGEISALKNRLQAADTDIDGLNASVDSVKADIKTLSDNEVAQNNRIGVNESDITGIKESLISDVSILDGATTGNIKIRIDRNSATSIDSNDYNIGRPVSAEIIQGTGPSMFKIQVTLSSGQVITSNDFVFTTEAIGTDIYISSFTFKAGTETGYISADIGLNNGVTIQANDFLIPTDPNVTTNISDLQTRMTTAESNIVNNTTEITDLKTSKVSADQGTINAGKILGINTLGKVEPVEGGSGSGEVWEELDLINMPADFSEGDRIKVIFSVYPTITDATSWTGSFSSSNNIISYIGQTCSPIEFILYNGRQMMQNLVCIDRKVNVTNNTLTGIGYISVYSHGSIDQMNDGTLYFNLTGNEFNGTSARYKDLKITSSNLSRYVFKMWRIKAN